VGDLDGVRSRLDYLERLGVTAIWLTPIHPSPSYHGYDVTDYMAVNPDFGTREDLVELVEAAHARGMRVIMDYVASHTSREHPFFQDALGDPRSPYADWYRWKDPAHLTYESFFGMESLPTVDHTSEEANRYFIEVARHWMDLDGDGDYTDGIDGFRCDYALGSPHAFWKELRASLKALNPEVVLLGEVWVDDPAAQAPYFEDEFDALFDFPLYHVLQGSPEVAGDGLLGGGGFVSRLVDVVEEQRRAFPPQALLVRFAGNHDTDRVASEVRGDGARMRLAAALVATAGGVPMLYYGEEVGLRGRKGRGPYYDEYRREPMPWTASGRGGGTPDWFPARRYDGPHDGVSVEEQDGRPGSLLSFYRHLYAVRAASPALREGAYRLLAAEPEGVWAFWRWTEDQVVSVVANLGAEPATVRLDTAGAPVPVAPVPVDLLAGRPVRLHGQALRVAPARVLVLDWTP
jgi:alpha-amylase